MGIRVEHSPSAKTIGRAAYMVGKGERTERELNNLRNQQNLDREFWERRAGRLYGQDLSNKQFEYTKQRDEDQRTHQVNMQQMQQADMLQRIQLEQKSRLSEMTLRNNGFLDSIALRAQLAAQSKPQYTPEQQKRIDQIRNMRQWIQNKVNTGEWTEQEASQVLEQSEMELLNIVPMEKSKSDYPVPEEEFFNRAFVDPRTGRHYLMQPDGKFEDITPEDNTKMTISDQIKLATEEAKYRTDLASEMVIDEDGITEKRAYTLQQIDAMANKIFGRIGQQQKDTQPKITGDGIPTYKGSLLKNEATRDDINSLYNPGYYQPNKPKPEPKPIQNDEIAGIISDFKSDAPAYLDGIKQNIDPETAREMEVILNNGTDEQIWAAIQKIEQAMRERL